jgi:hypothetical protein
MGKRPFVRFYHQDWASDGDVGRMSMQEVGVYWTLLVRQMVDRYVPMSFSELRRPLNVFTVDEAVALVTPAIRRKFHTASCKDKDCEGWYCNTPGEDATRLYNRRLTDVIIETDNASSKGTNNAFKRYEPVRTSSLESSLVARSDVEETPNFDFKELLTTMPKRRVKGTLDGWEQGKAMLKYIVTQEEFNDLIAATKAYARTRKGEDAAFHISLSNWVTKEYHRFVPAKTEDAPQASTEPSSTPVATAPVLKMTPKDWCVPDSPVRSTDKAPPWVNIPIHKVAERRSAAALFPDEESKHRWWMTPDNTESAGA